MTSLASSAVKEAVRGAFPRSAAYSAHLKALFQNEVELRLLPWLCNREETAIDAGAYTGTYTVGLSIYAQRVIAVEPQPRQAAALRTAMPDNVRVVEAALSDVAGNAMMKLSSPGGGSMSRLGVTGTATRDWPEIPVRLVRMDDLRTDRIGFVKLDVEGHEAEVLRGARYILQADKPNLLVELEERNEADAIARMCGFLQEFGYGAYFVRRDRILPIREFQPERDQHPRLLVGGQRRAYRDYINNFLFVHPDRSADVPNDVPSPWHAFFKTIGSSITGKTA